MIRRFRLALIGLVVVVTMALVPILPTNAITGFIIAAGQCRATMNNSAWFATTKAENDVCWHITATVCWWVSSPVHTCRTSTIWSPKAGQIARSVPDRAMCRSYHSASDKYTGKGQSWVCTGTYCTLR